MWSFITPQLPVTDLEATLAWYRDVLGFETAWSNRGFGAVSSDSTEIFFQQTPRPIAPVTCCVRVEDADSLYVSYKDRGVEIIADIEDKPWGMREFLFRDPDGHLFRVGHMIELSNRWVVRASR